MSCCLEADQRASLDSLPDLITTSRGGFKAWKIRIDLRLTGTIDDRVRPVFEI